VVIIVAGVFIYGVWRKHILISLLRLEYMVLGIYLLFNFVYLGYSLTLRIGYLTFSACEGALGLTILVGIRRSHGGDYFKSFHIY
jgi:NADH-ubiquinone oxidoreductase chain 4L